MSALICVTVEMKQSATINQQAFKAALSTAVLCHRAKRHMLTLTRLTCRCLPGLPLVNDVSMLAFKHEVQLMVGDERSKNQKLQLMLKGLEYYKTLSKHYTKYHNWQLRKETRGKVRGSPN